MTEGYLLDTQTTSYWFDSSRGAQHQRVLATLAQLGAAPLLISIVSLGEIHYGHRAAAMPDPAKQRAFLQFIRERFPMPLPLTDSTAECYGELRALLFEKFAPVPRKKGLRPEQLSNPVTGQSLGIQENDLWIASQAFEHNLILVTHDRMTHLRDIAPAGLRFADWTC